MRGAGGAAAVMLAATALMRAGAQPAPPAPARVECAAQGEPCRTDVPTYVGWRVFNTHCARCHGADAVGSDFAPDLTLRMRGMSMQRFYRALDQGYLGPDSPLPPHGRNPDVARYYSELWTYLSARERGSLQPGPLEPLPSAAAAPPQ